MSDSDSLAVQLFVGTGAIAALAVAMTQGGWTQKWFVRGMFALAAALAAAAIFWRVINPYIAPVGSLLSAAANNRLVWFAVGCALGSLVSYRFRAKKAFVGKVTADPMPKDFLVEFDNETGRVSTKFADDSPAVFIRLKVVNQTGRTIRGCKDFSLESAAPMHSATSFLRAIQNTYR